MTAPAAAPPAPAAPPRARRPELTTIAWLAAFAVVGLLGRIAYWRAALWEDTGAYLYVGERILEGGAPYVDAAEPKGPVLHLLFALISLVSAHSAIAVRLSMLVFVTLGAYAMWRYVEHFAGRTTGILAGFAFAVFSCTAALDGFDPNSEMYGVPLAVGAWWLATRGTAAAAAGAGALTAAAVGMNLGFAPVALLVGWELWRQGTPGARLKRLAAATGGGLALLAPIVVWLAAHGALDEAYTQIWGYSSRWAAADFEASPQRPLTLRDALHVPAGGLFVLGLLGSALALGNRRLRPLALAAAAWILLMWVRVKLNRSFEWSHHFYVALPGIVAGIAAGVRAAVEADPPRRLAAVAALVLVAPAWAYVVEPQWAALDRPLAERSPRFAIAYPMADFIRANTRPDDPVFVAGSEGEVYWLARRRAPTKWFANYVLYTHPELGAERERDLRADPPAAVAVIAPETLEDPAGDDVKRLVEDGPYRLAFDVGGGRVWLRQPAR